MKTSEPRVFRVTGNYVRATRNFMPNFSVLVEAMTAMDAGEVVVETLKGARIDNISHVGQSLATFADSATDK